MDRLAADEEPLLIAKRTCVGRFKQRPCDRVVVGIIAVEWAPQAQRRIRRISDDEFDAGQLDLPLPFLGV